jgi:hypothetical protein
MEENNAQTLTPKDAIAQISYLRELVEETRIRAADGYPFFVLWGLIWVAEYLATAWSRADLNGFLQPDDRALPLIWSVLTTGGGIVSGVLGYRHGRRRPSSTLGKRLLHMNLLLGGTVFVMLYVAAPSDAGRAAAYWPFWLGVIYLVNSVFVGNELAVIGAWLVAAGIASVFMPELVQAVWLAAAGGGALAVTGFIFRRQVRRTAATS